MDRWPFGDPDPLRDTALAVIISCAAAASIWLSILWYL